jgi:ABC-2 type transport system ATP-binding protein
MPGRVIGIEARRISKRLGPNQALDKVSLRFSPGLMHGLIGPEGAGKTTLLRTLLGLLRPDGGEILYQADGETCPFSAIRDDTAYMPQTQSLYPDLSIEEHLDFFRALYRIPRDTYKKRREELLHITRLDKFTDRPAGKLSGGMYKKLGLMCALLRSPQVMLLDEPTNGVDPISRREFWELLFHLSSQRILTLVATAYMDEAERCAEVHLIEAGQVIAEGEPQALLKKEKAESFDELFIRRARERETP